MFFCDNIKCGWVGEENELTVLKTPDKKFKKILCPVCFEESICEDEGGMVIDVKVKPTE